MSRQGLEERDLSTSLADLSIDQDQQHHQQRLPSSTSSSRKERAFGLLQDESMNLISGFGGDESTLGVGGGFQVVGGDDSFYGDEEEEQDQTLRRLPQHRTVVPETEEEENGESRLGEQRERVKAVEFGGSMAASTSRRFYEPTTTTSGTTGKRTESQGEKGNANDRMLEEAGQEYEDEDSDELLVLEDETCSAQDKERIKQLRNEREELRGMNKVLRQVVLALKTTESNITNLQNAANTSHELLDLYSRICSQAEHTKDLILDPDWRGLDADEQFLLEKQQAYEQEQERIRLEQEREQERILQEEREREEKKRRELEDAELRRKMSSTGGVGGVSRGGGIGRVSGGRVLVRGTRARPTTITSSSSSSTRGGRIPNPSSDTSSASFSGIPTFSSTTTTTSGRGSADVSGVRGVRGLRSRGGVSGIGRGRGGGRGGSEV
ncbi:hypothetical protein JCM5350_000856 [Sporobolomyces pararoseus]